MKERRFAFLCERCGFDYVIETRDVARDFTEFVVSYGGDVIRYRVYGNSENNFSIYEK